MNNICIANLFSGIGTILLAYSTFSKKKDKMLWIQVGDCTFNALGNLFAGSLSAMSTNAICAIRNLLNAKGKMSNKLSYVFSLIILIIGLIINAKGLIGIIPPLASVEYTIWSARAKSAQSLRYALLINLIFWFIHDCYIRLYPAMAIDLTVSIVTLINIIRFQNSKTTT